jgi:hypothetical protein
MKTIIILSLLSFSLTVLAKDSVNFKKFNKSFTENMDEVLADNPEVYEVKKLHRGPASVTKVKAEGLDKFDNFEEQAFGKKSW